MRLAADVDTNVLFGGRRVIVLEKDGKGRSARDVHIFCLRSLSARVHIILI